MRRRIAKVAFKLDGRSIKGRKAMEQRIPIASLRNGRHVIAASVRPKHSRAVTLKLRLSTKGC